MKLILAGYNLDSEVIEELRKDKNDRKDITPEVFSAAYARVTRNPRPIFEIRRQARKEIEKARKSNEKIIFEMGHSSVAEHAVFNFDLIDVSRLALEEIERFRLCSFTEKSQRYQKLENNFLIPDEIERNSQLKELFIKTVNLQNSFYSHLLSHDIPPEDARYITSLSTLGQVGITINARNLEYMVRHLSAHPLAEVREIGLEMYNSVKEIAPSIIKYTKATPFEEKTYPYLKNVFKNLPKIKKIQKRVALLNTTKNGEDFLIASLLFRVSNLSFESCLAYSEKLSKKKREQIIKSSLKFMEFYDHPVREFEYIDYLFSLRISGSCYAQLKRHRMITLTSQNYNPDLGTIIPETIKKNELAKEFGKITKGTEDVFKKLKKINERAAFYVLTNAHQRDVFLKCNLRELYHISRLREDIHAQWEIREIAKEMTKLAKKKTPFATLMLCGKHEYSETYKKTFKK